MDEHARECLPDGGGPFAKVKSCGLSTAAFAMLQESARGAVSMTIIYEDDTQKKSSSIFSSEKTA